MGGKRHLVAMTLKNLCFPLALGLWLLPEPGRASKPAIVGQVQVVDGDTLKIADTPIRLHGIDAVERGQPCTTQGGQAWACGDWVTRKVRDRYQGQRATCAPQTIDRYGRIVAVCHVAGQDIGQALVRAGWAFAYRKYSQAYVADEAAAARAVRGLHGYRLQSPARYRLTRIKGRIAPDPGCVVKGNINAKGTRIYHMPGQAHYDRTGIQPDKGERWFCSPAQARASGWRAARR